MMMIMSEKVVTIVLFCDFDMVARQMTQIGFYGSNIGVFNKAKIGSLMRMMQLMQLMQLMLLMLMLMLLMMLMMIMKVDDMDENG